MVNPDYETLSSAMTQPKRQNTMQIWSKNSFNLIFPRCFFDFVLRFSYYIKIQSPTKSSQVWPPWFQCFCSKELARKKKKHRVLHGEIGILPGFRMTNRNRWRFLLDKNDESTVFVWVISSWAIWVHDLCPVFCEEWDMAHVLSNTSALSTRLKQQHGGRPIILPIFDKVRFPTNPCDYFNIRGTNLTNNKITPNRNAWHWLCSNQWHVRNLKSRTLGSFQVYLQRRPTR